MGCISPQEYPSERRQYLFAFKTFGWRAGREMLRKMTDEAMYILSGMLPEHRQGFCADQSQATQGTIERVQAYTLVKR